MKDEHLLPFREMLAKLLTQLGEEFGYEYSTGNNPYLGALKKKFVQVYVYHNNSSPTTMLFTVTTQLRHPKKGKTQLHRRHCNLHEVRAILRNPRQHTGKGYFRVKEIRNG